MTSCQHNKFEKHVNTFPKIGNFQENLEQQAPFPVATLVTFAKKGRVNNSQSLKPILMNMQSFPIYPRFIGQVIQGSEQDMAGKSSEREFKVIQ